MKTFTTSFIIILAIALAAACNNSSTTTVKDLDESMIDMRVYHDNLGRYLRNKDADYSLWLLQGMDSSLQIIANTFPTHRKLTEPFEQSYKKDLQPSIADMKAALTENNFPAAVHAYQLLTKKCNGCHIDLDVDKEVIDWSNEKAGAN